jgi:hypothetical protein
MVPNLFFCLITVNVCTTCELGSAQLITDHTFIDPASALLAAAADTSLRAASGVCNGTK